MPEYTIVSLLSVLVIIILDYTLKTRLLRSPKFWIFIAISMVLQFIFDGFLTWRPVYVVNPQNILGIYLFTTPLENFIFGFSMLALSLIIFEVFNLQTKKPKN